MPQVVRLTQIDGKLPNLALMKLAHYHKARGDIVKLERHIERNLFDEPNYDRVYGSAIFSMSAPRVAAFRTAFPQAIVGGTHNTADATTVEQIIGEDHEFYDYSIYPDFEGSIGFTQRGCRLKCGFCVVPKKEGKAHSVSTIEQIYRGKRTPENFESAVQRWERQEQERERRNERAIQKWKREGGDKDKHPKLEQPQKPPGPYHEKHLHLLDNDFFGQPEEQWRARIKEIRDGGFKVCLNQGINTRMIDDESAKALASIPICDDSFKVRRLYTAWDNIGDEQRFFRGVETLQRHGIKPYCLLVYMLVGYDKRETWERLLYRFNRMTAIKIRPYPMIYGDRRRRLEPDHPTLGTRTLADFQRWAIRKYYTCISFEDYDGSATEKLPKTAIDAKDFTMTVEDA